MQKIKNNRSVSIVRLPLVQLMLLLLFLTACGGSKVYESYTELNGNTWPEDAIERYQFEVTDTSTPYNLYFTIKNGLDYPFHNIYVDFKLVEIVDGKEKVITKALKEYMLFNPRSGEPYGSGSSGWYDHELLLQGAYTFQNSGTYEIRLQQYMRKESLNEVATIGFAMQKAIVQN